MKDAYIVPDVLSTRMQKHAEHGLSTHRKCTGTFIFETARPLPFTRMAATCGSKWSVAHRNIFYVQPTLIFHQPIASASMAGVGRFHVVHLPCVLSP